MNVPNALTLLRIFFVPLLVAALMSEDVRIEAGPVSISNHLLALLIFLAAAFTDLLDGYLARKLGVVSVLGKFLDPLADKLIVMATLVWMVPMGRIPEWAVALLLARELSITGLRSIASSEGVVIAAGEGGKSKTALQMIGIIALIVGYPYHLSLGPLDLGVVDLVVVGRTLVYISLVFSITSAFQYVGLFAEAVEAKRRRAGGE